MGRHPEQPRFPDVGVSDDADHFGDRLILRDDRWIAARARRHVALPGGTGDRTGDRRGDPQYTDPGAAPVGLLRAADRLQHPHLLARGDPDRPVGLHGRLHVGGLSERHPGSAEGPSRGRAGPRLNALPELPPHRATAGDPLHAAAARLEFRTTDQVLIARRGDLGHRDHATGHGAVVLDVSATRDILVHRDRLFLYLLAAVHGDPYLGASPFATLRQPWTRVMTSP